jgi:hypothetical protein
MTLHDLGIKCRKGKPVNFMDPDNWQILYSRAHEIKNVVDAHIEKLLAGLDL